MLDHIAIGATTAAQAQEANVLAGNYPLKLTVMPNSRVIVSAGNIGLLEVVDGADLAQAMTQAAETRTGLRQLAAETPTQMFTFIRT